MLDHARQETVAAALFGPSFAAWDGSPEVWATTTLPEPSQLPGVRERMNVTGELFAANEEREQIPMQAAEVYYWRRFLPVEMAHTVLQQLIAEVPWRAETIVLWGKTFPLPRLTA